MSHSSLNIPDIINVGFQAREDTYNGKLAFVVYTDNKGKLRKEKSWNRWCDHKHHPPETFANDPTSGFVLNKKVGDYSSSWGGRKAWIRIYDPRGFEFEISVENLIFILEECSSIKGKGLDGEFVYAWDRQDLVVLPATTKEYRESIAHTRLQTKKVAKADMVPGCLYKTKDGLVMMYLGRHEFHHLSREWVWTERSNNYNYWSGKGKYIYAAKMEKQHIFVSLDNSFTAASPDCREVEKADGSYAGHWRHKRMPYWLQKGFTKLAERLTDEPDPAYADAYEAFMSGPYGKIPEVPEPTLEMSYESARNNYKEAYDHV
jgi:hypothetical protein